MRPMRMRLLAVALGIAVLSCKDAAAPQTELSGEYVLRSIGGDTLPTEVYRDDLIIQRVTNSYLELDSDNFTIVIMFINSPVTDTTKGGSQISAIQGHIVRTGDHVDFYFVGIPDPTPATLVDGAIRVHTATHGDWEYRK